MKTVTREMVRMYNLRKLGYDFMGYNIHNVEKLSFHHLIVPKRDCKAQGLGDGYYMWNGAILVQETSHDYLHIIERTDREMFLEITNLMIAQNKNERLDLESLKRIREVLLMFEAEHINDTNGKGKKLIKRQYIQDRIIL
jgi:hypothetical protein